MVCTYDGPITMPQFCPSEKVDSRLPTIYVSKLDLLVVLNRLLKLRVRNDQRQMSDEPVNHLFSHFSQSSMRREEFKLAIEIFGYRDVDLPLAYSNQSIQSLRQALEGRGQLPRRESRRKRSSAQFSRRHGTPVGRGDTGRHREKTGR